MHNGSRRAWQGLVTAEDSSRWFEALRPRSCSDLAHLWSARPQSPELWGIPSLQRPVSTQPRSGKFKKTSDISDWQPDVLVSMWSWEGIPILGLFNGSVIQNSFITKVSKKTFPPDIVIPYKSGIKTKHWFLLLRLNMKTEFLRQSTHYLQHEAVMLKQSHFYPHFITRDKCLQLTGIHLVFSHTQDITHLDNDFSECVHKMK